MRLTLPLCAALTALVSLAACPEIRVVDFDAQADPTTTPEEPGDDPTTPDDPPSPPGDVDPTPADPPSDPVVVPADDPGCPGTHLCAPSVPSGWSGPVTMYEGALDVPAPPCVGNWSETTFEGFSGLDTGKTSCECSCGDADGTSCAGDVSLKRWNGCGGIGFLMDTIELSSDSCVDLGGIQAASGWTVEADLKVDGGSCEPWLTERIPEPTWASQVQVCSGGADAAQCGEAGDGLCLPAPPPGFHPDLCIMAPGNQECPEGAYSVKVQAARDYDDTRACGECSCSAPKGSCDADVDFVSGSGCGFGALLVESMSVEAECTIVDGAPNHVALDAKATASCKPSTGYVDGEVEELDTITVCCIP